MSIQETDDLFGLPPDHRRDRLTVAFITSLVALTADLPVRDIVTRNRGSVAGTRARQLAIYLAHVALSWPLGRVAFAFNRDRTTAGHAVRRVEDLRDDPVLDARLSELETCIRLASEPTGGGL